MVRWFWTRWKFTRFLLFFFCWYVIVKKLFSFFFSIKQTHNDYNRIQLKSKLQFVSQSRFIFSDISIVWIIHLNVNWISIRNHFFLLCHTYIYNWIPVGEFFPWSRAYLQIFCSLLKMTTPWVSLLFIFKNSRVISGSQE